MLKLCVLFLVLSCVSECIHFLGSFLCCHSHRQPLSGCVFSFRSSDSNLWLCTLFQTEWVKLLSVQSQIGRVKLLCSVFRSREWNCCVYCFTTREWNCCVYCLRQRVKLLCVLFQTERVKCSKFQCSVSDWESENCCVFSSILREWTCVYCFRLREWNAQNLCVQFQIEGDIFGAQFQIF